MRNLILAIVLTVWGTGIVLGRLFGDNEIGSSAYATGQNIALLLGFVMVGAGVMAIVKHFNARA
jgi:hypothetical protein